MQPAANALEIKPEVIDLVLVPGLCFDKQGYRLGYGKGYYDKLLPTLRSIPFVGITAEALIVDKLPTESFDVAMTHLVTETGMRKKEKNNLTWLTTSLSCHLPFPRQTQTSPFDFDLLQNISGTPGIVLFYGS